MTLNTNNSNICPYIHLKTFSFALDMCLQQCTKYMYRHVQQAPQTQIHTHPLLRLYCPTCSLTFTPHFCKWYNNLPCHHVQKTRVLVNCSLFLSPTSCWLYIPSASQVCVLFCKISSPATSVEALVYSLLLYGLPSSVFCPSSQSSISWPKEVIHMPDHITSWISHHLDKIQTPLSSGLYLQPHLPICTLYSHYIQL